MVDPAPAPDECLACLEYSIRLYDLAKMLRRVAARVDTPVMNGLSLFEAADILLELSKQKGEITPDP